MRTPKVSVIVPAYNAEKYLSRCLDSIGAQTLKDIEVIVVNDGSRDATGEIADTYARQDPRFRASHQKNKGVACARQNGLDHATGEFVIQFDADDWVEPDMLEKMYKCSKQTGADVVICDITLISKDGEQYQSQHPTSLDSDTVFGQMMQPELHAALWNKLIRRSCILEYNIRFVPDMKMEDQYFCLALFSHPVRVAYLNKALYHYDMTQNAQSTVNMGVPPFARIRPLELIAQSTDISRVQNYFDKAVLYIAYEALFFSKIACPNYAELFKKHVPSIKRAKGLPFRTKVLVLLRIYGVNIPIATIKRKLHRLA